ncbi:MAG: OmpH family outer membrane protein [Aquificota bacterium]|nr:OmpH family outer membrane protein [Aquificota bacterium]
MVVKFLILFLGIAGLSLAQARLACVDTNRILQESKLVASAQGELRSKLVEYQGKLSQKERRLEELKKQIESKAISQKAKEEKIKEYQKLEAEWRELQERAQRELAEMKQRLENMVYNRVKEAAEKIAKDRGFAGIIDCGVFIYRDPDMDITTEVIRMIDEPER